MLNIPSRKERNNKKAFDSGPLQDIEVTNRSQEVNDLSGFDYNPAYKSLNLFREGDSVNLDITKHSRYSKAQGLTSELKGTISKVLSEDLVNVSYWETDPPVIKTVPVNHVILHESNPLMSKFRFTLLKVVRRVRILLGFTKDF